MESIIEKEVDVCLRAILKWGKEKQRMMAIEELSELIKAITKYERYNGNEVWRIKILEECSNCEMSILQLRLMLENNTEEYDRIKENKIMNLDNSIENDDLLRNIKY